MKRRLEIRPVARDEFDDASDWYLRENLVIRDEFIEKVGRDLSSIAARPLAFPIVFGSSIRQAVLQKFPYSIFFTVDDSLIVVLAIFHNSRDPHIWRGRAGKSYSNWRWIPTS